MSNADISVQRAKPNLGIEPAPHVHCGMSTQKIMVIVLLSLLPAFAVITYFFGFSTIYQFLIAAITALFAQAFSAFLRSRSIKRALLDPSGLVTAALLSLAIPQLMPWYCTVVGTLFAMLVVRECFGGLGMNIFNPAMAGAVFLIVSVPSMYFGTWISPAPNAIEIANPARTFNIIFKGEEPQPLVNEIKQLAVQAEVEKAQQNLIKQQELAKQAQQAKEKALEQEKALQNQQQAQNAQENQANAQETNEQDLVNAENTDTSLNTSADDNATANVEQSSDSNLETNSNSDLNESVNTDAQVLEEEEEESSLLSDPTRSQILIANQVDALSGSTFLESIKTARKAGNVEAQVKINFLSPTYIGYLYLSIAYALGGLILIFTKVIRFQLPLAFLMTVGIIGYIWHYFDPNMSISAVEHLLMGGTILGAFYIITDPVTTCGTFKGRILFAMIIGLLVITIRIYGSYSDSVAFAVLLGNCVAPFMDVLTRRRPFGIGYRPGGLD